MGKYTGSFEIFDKFIGPRLRNIVQNRISRGYKKKIGKCEHCGTKKSLEAAHKHGRDRKTLMRKAYEQYSNGNELRDVDLSAFEDNFVKLHYPLEDNFLILCKPCHRKYDNVTEQIEILGNSLKEDEAKSSETLEIQIYPDDKDEFKELFLIYGTAYIKIYYENGRIETREWKAKRFSESSNLIGNLRSRPEFRQGTWQSLGIKKVEVEIKY